MAIELPREQREEAIASIMTYARDNFPEPIGSLAADALLNFFLEDIGPCIYNQAVADVQERLQAYTAEIDVALHQQPFTYWARQAQRRRGR
ncbi:MAG: DUF2164 domain-containing protein [Rhodothermales bacterium]